MAASARIPARDGSAASRRTGTNARLREQTLTAHRAQVRGQIFEKATSVGTRVAWVVLALVLISTGSWYGWKTLSTSELVSLRAIEVRGMARVPAAEVAALCGLKAGVPLVKLDLDAARKRLEADPWIADARMSRHWPHRAKIEIVERRAVARLVSGEWVAADGVVLPRRGQGEFPVLVGQGYKGGRIPMKRVVESLSTLEQMELGGWTAAIEQIALVSDGSMELRLAGLAPKVLVGSRDWKRSLARVGALRSELGEEVALFSEIDLRHGTCASLRRADGGL